VVEDGDRRHGIGGGTGIGGGIVLDGQVVRGRFGVAAEIGHLTIVPDGRRCGSGNQGRQEQSASGRALVAEARALATASPAIAPILLAPAGGRARAIDGPMVTAAVRECDEAALECFGIAGTWQERGIADLAAILIQVCSSSREAFHKPGISSGNRPGRRTCPG
jgi:glucokinase